MKAQFSWNFTTLWTELACSERNFENFILSNLVQRVSPRWFPVQILLDVFVASRRRRLEAEVVVEVVEGLGGHAVHVDGVVADKVLLQSIKGGWLYGI